MDLRALFLNDRVAAALLERGYLDDAELRALVPDPAPAPGPAPSRAGRRSESRAPTKAAPDGSGDASELAP